MSQMIVFNGINHGVQVKKLVVSSFRRHWNYYKETYKTHCQVVQGLVVGFASGC